MSKLKDKKVVALAVVALLVVGVGAFQFVGGGSAPKEATKSAKKSSKRTSPHVAKSDQKATESNAAQATNTPGNSTETGYSAQAGGTAMTAETTASTTHEAEGGDGIKTHDAMRYQGAVATNETLNTNGATAGDISSSVSQMSNLAPSPLSERDPFWVPPAGRDKPTQASPKPLSEVGSPAPAQAGGSASVARPIRRAGDTVTAMPAGGMGGSLPPVNPMAGPVGSGGAKPGADSATAPAPANGMKVNPSAPARLPGEFAYSLAGTVDGNSPVAVLQDDSGKQQMVQVGGRIGGGRVVRVSAGIVVVKHNGKLITMRTGGYSGKT